MLVYSLAILNIIRPFGWYVHVMANWYILWPFGTFYGHLVHFMAIWYILWPFGTFYGHLVHFMTIWWCSSNSVYFPKFWYIASRKIWQPWLPRLSWLIRQQNGVGPLWSTNVTCKKRSKKLVEIHNLVVDANNVGTFMFNAIADRKNAHKTKINCSDLHTASHRHVGR
jgi:hypothetical protein